MILVPAAFAGMSREQVRSQVDELWEKLYDEAAPETLIDSLVSEAASVAKSVEDVNLKPTEAMANAAKRGLKLRKEHGRGGTEVGVARARDISNRKDLSPSTVKRMKSFFARHEVDLDAPAAKEGHKDYPSAGLIAWLLWGGDPGKTWAESKVDQINNAVGKMLDKRSKDDKEQSKPAKPSERREGSDRNKPGSASGSRGGIEISDSTEKALKNKVKEHNEKHGEKEGKKVTLGMLKSVYRRGAGAFSTSHRPGMGRAQWAMARVNAFLHLVRTGKPKDSKYVTDNDLLPKGHPKRSGKKSADNCGTGAGGFQEGNTCATGEAASDLVKQIVKERGFTFNPRQSKLVSSGYAVSPFKQHELVVEMQKIMEDANWRDDLRARLKDYAKDKAKLLKRSKAHLGAWWDSETNNLFLDISLVVDDLEEAKQLARDNEQLAIYHLDTGETIDVGR